ncbi:hypothetical protein [Neobacillus notoginsengisoli]|uniref:hypothetical protein n=1 Tax=Neobacillus notoginsengisoli TaxID=1578198 RepID=UPI0013148BF7|nr:hypothetical protein [Neobacillus notoginsengisoli]
MANNNNHKDEHPLSDKQTAENMSDLVSIINAKANTEKIKKIIKKNRSTKDNKKRDQS